MSRCEYVDALHPGLCRPGLADGLLFGALRKINHLRTCDAMQIVMVGMQNSAPHQGMPHMQGKKKHHVRDIFSVQVTKSENLPFLMLVCNIYSGRKKIKSRKSLLCRLENEIRLRRRLDSRQTCGCNYGTSAPTG